VDEFREGRFKRITWIWKVEKRRKLKKRYESEEGKRGILRKLDCLNSQLYKGREAYIRPLPVPGED